MIAIIFAVLYRFKGATKTFVLIVNYASNQQTEEEVRRQLHEVKAKLRSKITKNDLTELTAELNLKVDNYNLTNRFSELPGVKDVTLVQYRGSYE